MANTNQNIVNCILMADLNNIETVKDLINRIDTNLVYNNPLTCNNNRILENMRTILYKILEDLEPPRLKKDKQVSDSSYIKTNYKQYEIGYTPDTSDSDNE